MRIYEAPDRNNERAIQLLHVWKSSVRAMHRFLSDAEREKIREYVPRAIRGTEHLILAETNFGEPIAFMGTENGRLEMLFVSPEERGKGIGGQLLRYGMRNYAIREVTVNEQNPQAVGFYEHMGFQTYKRTECDEQGHPYPLLYMKRKKA